MRTPTVYLCSFVDNESREKIRAREEKAKARAIALWQALQEQEEVGWFTIKNEAFDKVKEALDMTRVAFDMALKKGRCEELAAAAQKYEEALDGLIRAHKAAKKARTTASQDSPGEAL